MFHASRIETHVKVKADGLRNVDVFYDFQASDEIDSLLDKCQLIGVGTNALVFLLPPAEGCQQSDMLIRFEIQNPVGEEWTESLLIKLMEEYPKQANKLSYLLKKMQDRVCGRSVKKLIKITKQRLQKQIAAHNSTFRRNPAIVMPINSYYTYQGSCFASRMRYLDGMSLTDADPKSTLSDYALSILAEPNTENVLVGCENTFYRDNLIDICEFSPSDDENLPDGNESPRLYQ